jgi:hypothetical protein
MTDETDQMIFRAQELLSEETPAEPKAVEPAEEFED